MFKIKKKLKEKPDLEAEFIQKDHDISALKENIEGLRGQLKNKASELESLRSERDELEKSRTLFLEKLSEKEAVIEKLLEVLEFRSQKLTASWIYDVVSAFEAGESARVKEIKSDNQKIKSDSLRKEKEIKVLKESLDDREKELNELREDLSVCSSEKDKIVENIELRIRERVDTEKAPIIEKVKELSLRNARLELILDRFNNITPDHSLILKSISELQDIRQRLLDAPVIEKARRKISNSIMAGEKSYEEARARELEKGVLTEEEIDTIFQERKHLMPNYDRRKVVIVSEGVNTQGGHDPYR